MSQQTKAIPDGFHTVNVHLTVENASEQIAFLKQAFGGIELHCSKTPDGRILNAQVKIGDSTIMVGESKPRPATMYVYLPDVDAAYKRALEAGAKSLREPRDEFYGDRSGGVEDPAGNQWWIATHIEDVSHEESERRFAAMRHKH